MTQLQIQISPDVFKLRDPKVRRLLTGKLSAEAFSLLVEPGDPYVLIGNTIYALTEQEYYVLRASQPVSIFTEQAFKHMMSLEDLSMLSDTDRDRLLEIRASLPNCAACQYNRYKDEVYRLVKKYNIELPAVTKDALKDLEQAPLRDYPGTIGDEPISPKAFSLMQYSYKQPKQQRTPCMDCVEKHIAQAYVLGKEARMGYPEYKIHVVGHLGEAIDELPDYMGALRSTLEFCIARTNYTGVPYVPIALLQPFLIHVKGSLHADAPKAEHSTFTLDLTDEARHELLELDASVASKVIAICKTVDSTLGVENSTDSLVWEGTMATLADTLIEQAPVTANIVRNRRLMFTAAPALCAESGYSVMDIAELLKSK